MSTETLSLFQQAGLGRDLVGSEWIRKDLTKLRPGVVVYIMTSEIGQNVIDGV